MNDMKMCITTALQFQDLQNFCILSLVRRMNPREQEALAYMRSVLSAEG
jgi:hypothetical protein